MKLLRMAFVVGLAVTAFMAFGTEMASGAALCKTNANTEACPEPYFAGQPLEASLKKESSAILETTGGVVLDTCTATTLKGKVTNAGSSTESAKADIEELAWGGCTKTTDTVSAKGSFEFHWIEGTDNATLTASGTEWTVNTIFGSCVYGYGSNLDLGTLSGGSPATISINTLIPKLGGNLACPAEARWTASYTFTAPEPLYFAEGTAAPSGILCKTNANTEACPEPYFAGQPLEAGVSGSGIIETTGGVVLDTCTVSTLKGKVTNAGSSTESGRASIEELIWGPKEAGCTKTTDTLKPGSLEFDWIEGTDNATLTASGTEWTTNTIFGSCIYGTGENKDLGTLGGGSPATISISTTIPKLGGNGTCPAEVRWTATYAFTTPTPLYFSSGEATSSGILCKTNANTEACPEPYFAGQAFEASLKEGTTALLETLEGTVLDTCTATTLKGKVANAGSSTEAAKANIEELAWGGCTKTTDTVSVKGSLEFAWIEGTDNATLKASGTESTINTIFGSCIYGFGTSTDLGTLSGGSPATISISTKVPKISGNALCPVEARWTASYAFTTPEPLYFSEG